MTQSPEIDPPTLSLEHLRELAGGLRRRLGLHVAAGFLSAAEANDMLARLDRLITQRPPTGDTARGRI